MPRVNEDELLKFVEQARAQGIADSIIEETIVEALRGPETAKPIVPSPAVPPPSVPRPSAILRDPRREAVSRAVGRGISGLIETVRPSPPLPGALGALSGFGAPELREEAGRWYGAERERKRLAGEMRRAMPLVEDPLERARLEGEMESAMRGVTGEAVQPSSAYRTTAGAMYGLSRALDAPGSAVREQAAATAEGRPWAEVWERSKQAFLEGSDVREQKERLLRTVGVPPSTGVLAGVEDFLFAFGTDPFMLLQPPTRVAQLGQTVSRALGQAGVTAKRSELAPDVVRIFETFIDKPGGYEQASREVADLARRMGGDSDAAYHAMQEMGGPSGARPMVPSTQSAGAVATREPLMGFMGRPSRPLITRGPIAERLARTQRQVESVGVARQQAARVEQVFEDQMQRVAAALAPLSPSARVHLAQRFMDPYASDAAKAMAKNIPTDDLRRGAQTSLISDTTIPIAERDAMLNAADVISDVTDEALAAAKEAGVDVGEAANALTGYYFPRVVRSQIERPAGVGLEARTGGTKPRSETLEMQRPAAIIPSVVAGLKRLGITDVEPVLDPALAIPINLRDLGRRTAFARAEQIAGRAWGVTREALERHAKNLGWRTEPELFAHFREVKLPDMDEPLYVPADVWNEIDRLFFRGRYVPVLDKYLAWQRASGTVPAPGYHLVNTIGDLLQGARAGVAGLLYGKVFSVFFPVSKGLRPHPKTVLEIQDGTRRPLMLEAMLDEARAHRQITPHGGMGGALEAPIGVRQQMREAGVRMPLEARGVAEDALRDIFHLGPFGRWGRELATREANWVRFSVFVHFRKKGLSPEAAANAVARVYPDPYNVPKIMAGARRIMTYPTWVLMNAPIIGRQIAARPGVFQLPERARHAWNEAISEREGKQYELQRSVATRAPWLLPRGWTEALGSALPHAAVLRHLTPEAETFPLSLFRTGEPSVGVGGMLSPPLGAAAGLLMGREPFSGRPIENVPRFMLEQLGPIGASRFARGMPGLMPESPYRALPVAPAMGAVQQLAPYLAGAQIRGISPAQALRERLERAEQPQLRVGRPFGATYAPPLEAFRRARSVMGRESKR